MAAWTTATRTWASGEVLTAVNMNAQLRDFANAFGAWGSYTGAWTSSGTAPAIGNGSIPSAYAQIQKTIHFRTGVTFGTSTTFGTGNYVLAAPVAPGSGQPYWSWVGYALQGGTGYVLTLDCNSGATTPVLNYQSALTGAKTRVGATAPVTWTAVAGNGFWASGSYEAL